MLFSDSKTEANALLVICFAKGCFRIS